MKKGIKTGVGTLILSASLVSPYFSTSASAVEVPYNGTDKPPTQCYDCVAGRTPGNVMTDPVQKARWLSNMDKVNEFLRVNSEGKLALTGTAVQIGVSQEYYDRIAKALEGENSMISRGLYDFEYDKDGMITKLATNDAWNANYLLIRQREEKAGGGVPQYMERDWHWYGYGITLTHAETSELLAHMAVIGAGAGAAALFLAEMGVTIPASLGVGLVGAMYGLSMALIADLDNGKGITIGVSYIGHVFYYSN
ncbi:hypothetical protein [Fictibacillus fluitans]|uniref:Uncharacterized protein n=1 Tax=Fictibacillus fluitans TaxID=3058422 RepID=A0ABT8HR18_9BACL|nr:hypothetical protein [Fictibacillus sp. NE201]MDN4523186.1 hypothetical protein [Fictibacillus sp. NE201]